MTISTATPSRRAALGALAGVPALALPAGAMAALADDSEILRLEVEIRSLRSSADDIQTKRVDPTEGIFSVLVKVNLEAACAYGDESGREAALEEIEALDLQANTLLERMVVLPALTPAGRAAKVRTLLFHALGPEWRGPEEDLNYDIALARAVLGEFAGMSADELAAV